MKKISITTLLLAIFICSQAQDKKPNNNVLIGFNLGYSNQFIEIFDWYGIKSNTITFKPTVGVFLSKTIAVGASYEISYSWLKDSQDEKVEYNRQSVLLFSRWQIGIKRNFKAFLEPYLGKSLYSDDDEGDINTWNTGANFGIMYFTSDDFSLEINLLEASWVKQSSKSSDEYLKEFNVFSNFLNPNIGLRFYF